MRRPSWRMEVIAHRGSSHEAPENTLAALKAAIQCGADRVEFDVGLTRDGVPVVIHDETLDRTTAGKGKLSESTFAEIEELDAGSWFHARFKGERVPTLDRALALCAGRIPVNVEIKPEAVNKSEGRPHGGAAPLAVEAQVVDAIRRHGLQLSAIVSSFEPLALERVRWLAPEIARETLFKDPGRPPRSEDLDAARRAGSRSFNLSWEELLAGEALVEEAHSLGLGIKVYTVDEPGQFERLLRLGVDGAFTNRPRSLLSFLKAHSSSP